MGLSFAQIPAIPLDKLLSGFNAIITNLFGIQIKRCPLNNVESDSFKNQLQKFLVLDYNANHVGTLYLDLYARPDKLSAPAQFTVQNPSPGQYKFI
ncbi:hypothetical protein BVRB_017890 [Beta vulgaris subsp. vulgaris]|uniref:Peptidase M3A/M3B catalytic domain-containing protein n=1 Tax=Beta vulgaris subsp. vulgaris TaxID=3555 RepID=A0A0J7YLY5_BETVV|nr:hypothetical protein BVRB_017890 [Beta vulgaris subsp. vulgaris]